MTPLEQQPVCPCCETMIETMGGCAMPLHPEPCAVKGCTCATAPGEGLCEDCYLWEK